MSQDQLDLPSELPIVEPQAQAPLEGVPDEPVQEQPALEAALQPSPDNAELEALKQIAIPDNTATDFVQADDPENAARADTRMPDDENIAAIAIANAEDAGTFIRLVNEGNLLEMRCNREIYQSKGESFAKVIQFIGAILAAVSDPVFHGIRCNILQPIGPPKTASELQGQIDDCKGILLRQPGVPSGVSLPDISWDALSFKTPPNGLEFFCQRIPYALQKLDMEHMTKLQNVEQMITDTIRMKCAEYRARTNTKEDEFINDLTVYLENQIAGAFDEDRQDRIQRVGRNTLILYVQKMSQLFLTGNLPASVQPAKIYSCHDIVTAAELRASIQKTAERQLAQVDQLVESRLVIKELYQSSSADQNWTEAQAATIQMRRNIDTFGRRAARSMGTDYDRPMKNLENQLAGSFNTLKTQLEVATGDYALHVNEEQAEVSRQQLSVLLACLRMRANAVMTSEYELMTDDDLDHLEIVKYLARQLPEIGNGANEVFKLAYQIQLSYERGHNLSKMSGKELPRELYDHIHYTIRGRAKNLLRAIPMFNDDINAQGRLVDMFVQSVIMSAAQNNRIENEYRDRHARKTL